MTFDSCKTCSSAQPEKGHTGSIRTETYTTMAASDISLHSKNGILFSFLDEIFLVWSNLLVSVSFMWWCAIIWQIQSWRSLTRTFRRGKMRSVCAAWMWGFIPLLSKSTKVQNWAILSAQLPKVLKLHEKKWNSSTYMNLKSTEMDSNIKQTEGVYPPPVPGVFRFSLLGKLSCLSGTALVLIRGRRVAPTRRVVQQGVTKASVLLMFWSSNAKLQMRTFFSFLLFFYSWRAAVGWRNIRVVWHWNIWRFDLWFLSAKANARNAKVIW